MRPALSSLGFYLATAASLFVVTGTVLAAWSLVALGFIQLSALGLVYLLFLYHALMFHRRRVEFAWWISVKDLPAGSLSSGHPVRVQMLLRNHSPITFPRAELTPLASSALHIQDATPLRLRLPQSREVHFEMKVIPRAAGHWFLQGLAIRVFDRFGLFVFQAYFPSPLSLKVFPPSTLIAPPRLRLPIGAMHDRSGPRILRRRGLGSDLRELREHVPGDPFRHIAWKASARTGKLMAREYEQEVVHTQQILLDTSPSMRGEGRLGGEKLDTAMTLCGSLTRRALDAGDRVGFIAFDTRIVDRIDPADGIRQFYRILGRLLDLHRVVDEDLTDMTDGEICSAVADYLAYQRGQNVRVDVPPKSTSPRWQDLAVGRSGELVDLRATLLEIERVPKDNKRQGASPFGLTAPRASDPRMMRLRQFCQQAGIEIPYRRFSMISQKTDGMADALEAVSVGRAARTVILISDLLDLHNPETILRLLVLAKRRQHHVIVIQPPDSPRQGHLTRHEARVHAIVALRQDRERRALRHALRARGIPLFDMNLPSRDPQRSVPL